MLLYVSIPDLQRLLDALKSAYLWLFSAISGLWNTIQNNTLLMTTVMLFLVLSIAFLFLWLIITIAPASFGKNYAKFFFSKYPNPNSVYFTKLKVFPFLQKKKSVYDTNNLATNKAFEKVNKQYYYDRSRASKYFQKHPDVNSIIINGRRFTRRDK